MKRLSALLFALALTVYVPPSLAAEDVMTVEAASVCAAYTSDREYLRVLCPLTAEGAVTLTVTQGDGSVIYQRSYADQSGSFRSEDIYLPYNGGDTLYSVSVAEDGASHDFTVTRVMPRLRDNAACSVGYPLSSLSGASSWKTATLLDAEALEGTSMTVPLHASGAYTLGAVTFSVSGGMLTVSAAVDSSIDGSIDKARVYVATTALEAQTLGTRDFSGVKGSLNSAISLAGSPYAAVYVNLTVSFDAAGVPGSPETFLEGQDELWLLMQQETANEAVG